MRERAEGEPSASEPKGAAPRWNLRGFQGVVPLGQHKERCLRRGKAAPSKRPEASGKTSAAQ